MFAARKSCGSSKGIWLNVVNAIGSERKSITFVHRLKSRFSYSSSAAQSRKGWPRSSCSATAGCWSSGTSPPPPKNGMAMPGFAAFSVSGGPPAASVSAARACGAAANRGATTVPGRRAPAR